MATEDIPTWISIVGNFGFPIAITVYLFARFERKLDGLEKVILELSAVIKRLKNKGD
ncbi:YvrJ family protein [Virgibacillus kimchii]